MRCGRKHPRRPEQGRLTRLTTTRLWQLLLRKLIVKAHERRIVVVEDMLTPAPFREALADVLFRHYQVCAPRRALLPGQAASCPCACHVIFDLRIRLLSILRICLLAHSAPASPAGHLHGLCNDV